MKRENGVSLFEVIIAIIILLFIAFFAIYNTRNSVGSAKATEVRSEMISVQNVIGFIQSEMVAKDGFTLQAGQHYDVAGAEEDTYVIYGFLNHTTCDAAKYLGLENLKRDYVVNYKTGEFRLNEQVDVQGTKVSTLDEVNGLINNGIK